MTCFYCKGSMTESTTTHVVDLKECIIIIIRNVPCLKCEQCGETYFENDVALAIEKILDTIQYISSELTVTVIDYANNRVA